MAMWAYVCLCRVVYGYVILCIVLFRVVYNYVGLCIGLCNVCSYVCLCRPVKANVGL